MADYINVNTDTLRTMATEVGSELAIISSEFDSMLSVANSTSAYWEGDGADTFRASLNSKKSRMDNLLVRLREYIDDLNTIGQVYDTVEKQSQNLSAALETDVIF